MSRRALWGYLASVAVSLTGTRISMIAIPWLVLTTTDSATKTGIAAFVEMAPLVVAQALSGPLMDRLGSKRVAIGCDLGSVVVVGAIPLLAWLDRLSFPLLLVLVGVAGTLRGPGDAARHALVPVLVASGTAPMERITGLAGAVERTASMAGGALAGALVALVGPSNALIVDAASFLIAAVVLRWATAGIGDAAPAEPGAERTAYLSQLREGWRFLRRDHILLGLGVMVALTNLLDQAYFSVLLPVWARETGTGVWFVGVLTAVFGGASVLGALTAAWWGERMPRYPTYVVAFLICGAPRFVVLATEAPLWPILAVSVVGGYSSGFLNPLLGAVIFERIPPELTGRVSALHIAMSWSMMPLGGLLAGFAVAGLGLSPALLAAGAAYFVVTTAPALLPSWREMDRRPAPVVASEDGRSRTAPGPG